MSDLILYRAAPFGPLLSGSSIDSSKDALAPHTNGGPTIINETQVITWVNKSSSICHDTQPVSMPVATKHLEADGAPRKPVDEQPKGIRDMSVNGMSPPVMVSIRNGDDHRQFDISRELLLAKGIDFGEGDLTDETVKCITMHDVNADAFNLFVMWLYGYDLPKVAIPTLDFTDPDDSWVTHPSHCQSNASQSSNLVVEPMLEPLSVPVPGPRFASTLQPDRKGSLVIENFQHICFMKDFKRFSVDEIRLANAAPASAVSSSPSERAGSLTSLTSSSAPNLSYSGECKSPCSLKRGRSSAELPQMAKRTKIEADLDSGNEKIQTLLLELALLAHQYGWTQCFNLAVDTYRHGERELNRKLPKLDHIRLAYKNLDAANTPVALLMADYAFYKAAQAGLTEFARTVFLEKPTFMQDYVARLDGKVQVPGCKVFRGDETGFRIYTEPTGVSPSSSRRYTPLDDFSAEHYHMEH